MAYKSRRSYGSSSRRSSGGRRSAGYKARSGTRSGSRRSSSRRSGPASGRSRGQTLKIVIEQAAQTATTNPFDQAVSKTVGKARF